MGARLRSFHRGICPRWNQIVTRWKIILAVFVSSYILHQLETKRHIFKWHAHTVTPLAISFTNSINPNERLAPKVADSFCRTHRFPPYPEMTPNRKIYDLFIVQNELDWLEIRLETLLSSVDYFILIESSYTFTGARKPLFLRENWSRFERFHHKIIHHVVRELPESGRTTSDVEAYQRNALFSQIFPHLKGDAMPLKGDIIVVSDVDEIPRPASMVVLRNCDVPRSVTLRSQFYHYSFQWKYRGDEWKHGQATIFGGFGKGETILPNDLRSSRGVYWWNKVDLWNAGWHCSACFATIEEMLMKMSSLTQTRSNEESLRNQGTVVDRVRNGKDLFDGEGERYVRVDQNQDVPEILKGDRRRWEYLLNRDGENAGFRDVH